MVNGSRWLIAVTGILVLLAPCAYAGTTRIFGPDNFEPDDDPMNAAWIALKDGTQTRTLYEHNFDLPGDVDWSKFVAPRNLFISVQTSYALSLADTFVSVYRVMGPTEPIIDVLPSECLEKVIIMSDGTRLAPVACSDDWDGSLNSKASFSTGDKPAIYYMRVTSSPKAGNKDDPSGPLTSYSSEAVYFGIVPGTMQASVYDQAAETPITTAIVTLSPLNMVVTTNTNGVYTFGALPDDTYTMTVEAPGYATMLKIQAVNGGGFFDLQYPLVATSARHSGDYDNPSYKVSLGELLRLIQFYNTGGFHCDPVSEDRYGAGYGGHGCAHHNSDYAPFDWKLELGEILRMIQFYNSGGYHVCEGGEDGFCAGP